ncbi:type II secretion system F family protein [Actinomycetota bacterium]
MTVTPLLGGLLGALLSAGLILTYIGLPHRRRPGLEARLMPYLRDTPKPSRLLSPVVATSPLRSFFAPLVTDSAQVVERFLGGSASVRSRLLRAGKAPDVDRFRAEQVIWGAGAAFAGSAVSLVAWLTRGASPVSLVLLVLCSALTGIVARDQMLSRQATARERQMLAEFPTIAELLALAVAAGEGAVGALERVTRLSHGELSGELARCLADARAGANLPIALQGLADRTGLVSLARFVDGIVVAVERGTPLAEVLRAQAQDVREAGRRATMEEGGKKEITMMVPVVFLVLPVTVLFAVFPGFSFMRFTM